MLVFFGIVGLVALVLVFLDIEGLVALLESGFLDDTVELVALE